MAASPPYIFRYPGGKSRASVRRKIMAKFPRAYREFRDAMVGGGGVFFAVPLSRTRWVNDLNPGLVEVYRALRDRPGEFLSSCRAIRPAEDGEPLAPAKGGKPLYNARLKAVFDSLKDNEACDQALRYFFINRTVWGGRVVYGDQTRLYFSNPRGWNVTLGNTLEVAAAVLSGVKVTCGDYSAALEAPGDDVLVYLDPPYVVNTKMSERSRLYSFSFTMEDHATMASRVRACPHKVCISYDDDPDGLVRSLYPASAGFRLWEEEWTYAGSSREKKVSGKELVITNYDPRAS